MCDTSHIHKHTLLKSQDSAEKSSVCKRWSVFTGEEFLFSIFIPVKSKASSDLMLPQFSKTILDLSDLIFFFLVLLGVKGKGIS